MLPSGVFVRIALDSLLPGLPERLKYHGPSRLAVELLTDAKISEEPSTVEISQWSGEWCLIEMTGPVELNALVVESLTGREPVGEVLSCDYHPEVGEYGYALYREGQLVESFESRGPSVETVAFTSELRKVSLQHILKSRDFMNEAVRSFGIDPDERIVSSGKNVIYQVGFPGKRTFWQTLLGAISPD